jgi:hypothetical protein
MTAYVPRARRLGLAMAIRYRRPGDHEWVLSRVLNISESGVLFGPTALEPGAPVEVTFSAPVAVGALGPGSLVCAGQVVRATEAGAVGARFAECRFLLEA